MRLINAKTYQLEEFWNEDGLNYAILSHRWENAEVTFQDMQEIQDVDDLEKIQSSKVRAKKGFSKIESCCIQARYDKIDYVWVDTCCIDKSSSAELTEAINSMFRWYKQSKRCYAFLSDVSYSLADTISEGNLRSSKWFERGWTLQELVAPRTVIFYDRDWELLGTKQSLALKISEITGIDGGILAGDAVSNRSIAQRMSWASKRVTTRAEDMAYSLLGIFDVNMPLLYGEGTKAFLRLQEEIIRSSDDHTIFAWPHQNGNEPGLLAQSPAAFSKCGSIRAVGSRKGKSTYVMTNRGLSISLDATPWNTDTYLVALSCVDEKLYQPGKHDKPIEQYKMGMFIRRLDEDDQFIRITNNGTTFSQQDSLVWEPSPDSMNPRPVHKLELKVRQWVAADNVNALRDRIHGFRLNAQELLETDKHGKELFKIEGPTFNKEKAILSMPYGKYGTVGILDISAQERKIKAIKLGFDFDYNPVCFVAERGGLTQKVHALDRQGNLNFGNDWMWNENEQAEFKSIYQRSCFDTTAWSSVTGGSAAQLKHHSGLWAIKGDRIHGVSVRLQNFDYTNTMLEIKKGECDGKLVWDVSITGIRDTLTRSLKPSLPGRKASGADVKNIEENGSARKGSGLKLFGKSDK